MIHKIQSVIPKDNLIVEAIFFNGAIVHYDVKQLFTLFPQFQVLLKQPDVYRAVKVDQGGYGISWNDDLDIDANSIWENGILIEQNKTSSINHLIAYQILLARKKENITQKELAERTGIYQAEISKIERGIGNPSVNTLKRLAKGLNMQLKIDFIAIYNEETTSD